MEKISIIVPVYNSERYLKECIESLIRQDYKNTEIILINDGSKDSSGEIIEAYASKDRRIKPIHIENSGVSVARNRGLEEATGKWITFVDSDDWCEYNMLSFAMEKAIETKSDIIVWSYFKNYYQKELPLSLVPGGNQTFSSNKDLLYLKSIYALYGETEIKENVSTGTVWCKLYKKSMIDKDCLRFKPGLIRSQDTIFSINAFEKANKISYFDKNLYHYRITNSSTCSGNRFMPDSEKPFNLLLEEFDKFIKKQNDNGDFKKVFDGRVIQVLMWNLKHNYFHPDYSNGNLKRRADILSLINNEPYKTALSDVNCSLLPKKEKTMVRLFRKKLILIFHIMYTLYSKFGNGAKKKYK